MAAQERLEITAQLRDLVSKDLTLIGTRMGELGRAVDANNVKAREFEINEMALARAIKQTTTATVEATKATNEKAASEKKSTETQKAASTATKAKAADLKLLASATQQASFGNRELAETALNAASGIGLSTAAIGRLAAAAGPIAALATGFVLLAEGIGGALEKTKLVDEALSRVAGRIGSDLAFGQLREDIRKLSNEYQIAIEDIAGGVASVFQNTAFRTREEVNVLVKEAAKLSKTGFGSVAAAVDSLDAVLDSLQLGLGDVGRVTAVLATSSDRAGESTQRFADSLKVIAPLTRQFGLSIEDTASLFVTAKNQGLELNEAVRAIGTLLTVANDETNTARKTLEALGVNFKGASRDGAGFVGILSQINEVTKNRPDIAAQLFPGGTRTLKGIFGIVQGAAKEYTEEVIRAGNATEDFAVQVEKSTALAKGYWKGLYNSALNETGSFWEGVSDYFTIGFARLTGTTDLAMAEIERSLARRGSKLKLFDELTLEKQIKEIEGKIDAAFADKDFTLVAKLAVDRKTLQDTINRDILTVAEDAQDSLDDLLNLAKVRAGPMGIGTAAVKARDFIEGTSDITGREIPGIKSFVKSLELSEGEIVLLVDKLNRKIEDAQDKVGLGDEFGARFYKAFSESIAELYPELDRFTADSSAGLETLNEKAKQFGVTFKKITQDGKTSFEAVLPQGPAIDPLAKFAEERARALEAGRAAEKQAIEDARVLAEFQQLLVDGTKAREAAALAFFQSTLPKSAQEIIAAEKEIDAAKKLIAQYEAEGAATEYLVKGLDRLIYRRDELIRASQKQRDTSAPFFLGPLLEAGRQAAIAGALTVNSQELEAQAQELFEESLKAVQEAYKKAQEGGKAVLSLTLTPQLSFDEETLDRLTVEALMPLGEQLNELQAAFEAGSITAAEFNASLARIRDEGLAIRETVRGEASFVETLAGSFEELRLQISDTQMQAQGFAADLTQGLTSAFEGLFQNIAQGKASLRDFGAVILQVITQAIARLAALQTASAFLNIFSGGAAEGGGGIGPGVDGVPLGAAARGGIIPGHMVEAKSMTNETASRWRQIGSALKAGSPVRSYARGGVADRPQVAVFGEGGAEAFVPLPGPNRGIPVEFKSQPRRDRGGDSAPATQVALTLNVGSLDPRTAADVVLAQMPQIQAAITQAIQAGRDRALLSAVRGAMR